MPRYILEGEWTGYTSAQRKVVHREVIPQARYKPLSKLHAIRFTDGTSLILSMRPAAARQRVQEVRAYEALIREAERAGQSIYVVTPKPPAPTESVASRLLDARLERAMGRSVDDDLADMLD